MTENFDFTYGSIDTYRGKAAYYDITRLKETGCDLDTLPYSIRVLLENTLRHAGSVPGASDIVRLLTDWPNSIGSEIPFKPHRVLMQDYTGVPLIVDLAAMRDALVRTGRDPKIANSKVPVDLVIDHSVQVDFLKTLNFFPQNLAISGVKRSPFSLSWVSSVAKISFSKRISIMSLGFRFRAMAFLSLSLDCLFLEALFLSRGCMSCLVTNVRNPRLRICQTNLLRIHQYLRKGNADRSSGTVIMAKS